MYWEQFIYMFYATELSPNREIFWFIRLESKYLIKAWGFGLKRLKTGLQNNKQKWILFIYSSAEKFYANARKN